MGAVLGRAGKDREVLGTDYLVPMVVYYG